MRRDAGLAMTRDTFHLDRTKGDLDDVKSFMTDKFSNYDGVEFFWYPPQDKITAYQLDFDGTPSFDPASTATYYDGLIERFPDLAFTGGDRETFLTGFIG